MRRALAALAFFALVGSCSFPHDPDTELYRCSTNDDCGAGDVCVQRKTTGDGICFPSGQCTADVCNGKDDDCDGLIDDVPDAGEACISALPGACAPGVQQCLADGGFGCVSNLQPAHETCDGSGQDLDCDGLADCADPDCDDLPACGDGCICRDGGAHETDCGNGLDDDGDGLVDCVDPDCLGQGCGAGGNCGLSGPAFGDAGVIDAGFDAGPLDSDAGADAGTVDLDAGADAGSFDLDAGAPELDGGAIDAGPVDAGPLALDAGNVDAGAPASCVAPELVCDDGLDDDGDRATDCFDSDCLGQTCSDGGFCLADGGCGTR